MANKKITDLTRVLTVPVSNIMATMGVSDVEATGITVENFLKNISAYFVAAQNAGFIQGTPGSTVLPNRTDLTTGFMFLPAGTYTQTTGANIVLTSTLNEVVWNGTTYSLLYAYNIDTSGFLQLASVSYDGVNKFSPATKVTDSQVSNGGAIAVTTGSIMFKIPVGAGETYYIVRTSATGATYVCFFDASMVLILVQTITTGILTVPTGAAFMVGNTKYGGSGGVDVSSSTMIAASSVAIPYQAYSPSMISAILGYPLEASQTTPALSLSLLNNAIAGVALASKGTNVNDNFALTDQSRGSLDWYNANYNTVIPTPNATLLGMGILNVQPNAAVNSFYYRALTGGVDLRGMYVQTIMYILVADISTLVLGNILVCNSATPTTYSTTIAGTVVSTLIETGLYEVRTTALIPTSVLTTSANMILIGSAFGTGAGSGGTFSVGGFLLGFTSNNIAGKVYTVLVPPIDYAFQNKKTNNRVQTLENEYINRILAWLIGKSWLQVGDSITFGFDLPSILNTYAAQTAARNSMKYTSAGVSSTALGGTASTAMVQRIQTYSAYYDIVGVYGGTNDDFTSATYIGALGDTTNATFYGSLEVMTNYMLTTWPTSFLFFMCPARYTTDVRLLLLNKAIKDVCNLKGIPVYDLAVEGGIYPAGNAAQKAAYYVTDTGTNDKHPNTAGHTRMSYGLQSFFSRHAKQ